MTDPATGPADRTAPASRARTAAACCLLVALYLALRLPGLLGNSATYDEPIYAGASIRWTALQDDRAAAMLYHPPLAYHLIDLPLRALDTSVPLWDPAGPNTQGGLAVLYGSTFRGAPVDPHTVIVLARLPVLAAGALGMWLLFAIGARLAGRPAGWLASAMWAGFPEAAAQSIQATTDCVAAVAAFGLALAALRHLDAVRRGAPSRATLVALGAAAGLALLAKHTLLVHVAVVAVLLAAFRALTLRRLVVAGAVAAAVVWAGYGFEFRPAVRAGGAHETLDRVAAALGLDPATLDGPARTIPLPAPAYLRSVLDALFSKAGARSGTTWTAYMAGEWSERGFLLWFPYATLLKTPIALLAATAVGLAGLRGLLRDRRQEATLVLALFAVPFAAAVASRLNIGFRHLLPTLPFLFVAGLAGLTRLATLRAWRPASLAAACALLAAEAFRTADDPICFSSLSTDRLHMRLADSNLEMGQDLGRLRRWARDHGVRSVAAFLHGPPGLYERECRTDPLFTPYDAAPTGGVLLGIRAEDQRGPVPADGLLAVGESVLVLPRWRALLDVPPLAQVHRTRVFALPR